MLTLATELNQAAWDASVTELAGVAEEMRAINETERKQQTPCQVARLVVLRAQCGALHYRRIALVRKKY